MIVCLLVFLVALNCGHLGIVFSTETFELCFVLLSKLF